MRMRQGLVYAGRKEGGVTAEKIEFQRPTSDGAIVPAGTSFAEAVRCIRPTAIIGAAARRGVFDAEVIRALVQASVCSSSRNLMINGHSCNLVYLNKSIPFETLSYLDCLSEFPVRCEVAGHGGRGGQRGSPPGAGTVKPGSRWRNAQRGRRMSGRRGRVLFASGTAFAPFDTGRAQPCMFQPRPTTASSSQVSASEYRTIQDLGQSIKCNRVHTVDCGCRCADAHLALDNKLSSIPAKSSNLVPYAL